MRRDRAGRRVHPFVGLLLVVGATIAFPAAPAASAPGLPIYRITLNPFGGNADDLTQTAAIDDAARLIAFDSVASNLVPEDTNGVIDVFVRDLEANVTTRISTGSSGAQGDAASMIPTISGDGRYVSFYSEASNLVAGDTNGVGDIFRRDLTTGTTIRVSTAASGAQLSQQSWFHTISPDGRAVAFSNPGRDVVSGARGDTNVYLKDLDTGAVERITATIGNAPMDDEFTWPVSISADRRFVSFVTGSASLVSGDTNEQSDVFVRDTVLDTTTRVSVDVAGGQIDTFSIGGSMSADGRYIEMRTPGVVVAPDTNDHDDVFVRDIQQGTVRKITVAADGGQTDGSSLWTAMSSNAETVVYASVATNLPNRLTPRDPGDDGVQIYAWSRSTGRTRKLTVSYDGSEVVDGGLPLGVSGDGRHVLFRSDAPNLVPGDTNGTEDIFLVDLAPVPDAPGRPTVSSGRRPTLTWAAPPANGYAAPTGYRIRAYRGGVDQRAELTVPLASTQRSAVVDGLLPGRAYRFTIAAANGAGHGPESPMSQFVLPPWATFDSFTTPIGRGDGAIPSIHMWFTGRAPTSAEIGARAEQILTAPTGAAAMVVDLTRSSWMTGKVAPSTRLYAAYFERLPDTTGLRYWVGRLAAGKGLRWVSSAFAASAEFRQTYGTLGDDAFVRLVYRNVLGREPDPSGLRYWRDRLATGTPRGEVMTQFSESAENRAATESMTMVVRLFFGLVDRSPTTAELERWQGRPATEIATMLLGSASLEARVR